MEPEKTNGKPVAQADRDREPLRYAGREAPNGRRFLWLGVLVILGVLGAGCYFLLSRLFHGQSGAGNAGKGAAAKEVPVVAVPARKGDLHIYLTGLGTVIPLNTVTVRGRVDGQINNIAFHEGQLVHEGDLLLEIDPRPFQVQLTQAQGQMAKDQAQLENAKRDLERFKFLVANNSIPQQQVDAQDALVSQIVGTVESDQGQIDSAKLNLTYSRITAPLTGKIGLRLVDKGNMVHANDPNGLLVITQIQPIAVLFTLAEDDIPQVQMAMKSDDGLVVDAYNRDLKAKLATGSLLAIDNQVDPGTGTVRLKALFPNEDSSLFPNQFVNARLLVDTKRGSIIIPAAAVQRSPASVFVYVVKADNSVETRNVVVGPTEGDEVSIETGLAPGDLVVTDGVDKLLQGMKVAVVKPQQANRAGGAAATRPAGTTRPAGAAHPAATATTQPTSRPALTATAPATEPSR